MFPVIVHCDRNLKVPLTVPDELPLELHNTGAWSGNFFVFTTKRQLNLNKFAISLKFYGSYPKHAWNCTGVLKSKQVFFNFRCRATKLNFMENNMWII